MPTRPARALAWLFLVGVVVRACRRPFVPTCRSPDPARAGFVWKALPLVVELSCSGACSSGLHRGRPALIVYRGAALIVVLPGGGRAARRRGHRAHPGFPDRRRRAAAPCRGRRHALFSASLLLPVDFYVGRQLDRDVPGRGECATTSRDRGARWRSWTGATGGTSSGSCHRISCVLEKISSGQSYTS